MYYIGDCKVCDQGRLEIVKAEATGKLLICCEECYVEWYEPSKALKGAWGTRGKSGALVAATWEEIQSQNWQVPVFEGEDY